MPFPRASGGIVAFAPNTRRRGEEEEAPPIERLGARGGVGGATPDRRPSLLLAKLQYTNKASHSKKFNQKICLDLEAVRVPSDEFTFHSPP